MSRELICIQAGPASNWVGAHFWNLQENSVYQNSDDCVFSIQSLFRSKERTVPADIRPRLLVIDTLGSIRSPYTKMISSFPHPVTVAWDGDIQTVLQDDEANCTMQADDDIQVINRHVEQDGRSQTLNTRYWTDCLLPTTRHRWKGEETVSVIKEFLDSSSPGDVLASPSKSQRDFLHDARNNDCPSVLSSFTQGTDLYRPGSNIFEAFEDRFHQMVEECDRPSGFFFLVDSDSGFSGVGLRMGEYLSEEFAKRPLLTFAIASSFCQNRHRCSTVCLNRVALYSAMEEASSWPSCSAWIPMMDAGDACSISSRLATALTTLLTPMLLKPSHKYSSDLHGFVNSLTPTRKKMMSLSVNNNDVSSAFQSKPKWTHTNTFSVYQKTIPDSVSSCPLSLACHFSTRGFDLEGGQFVSFLPHSGGFACSLEEGLQPRLSCCLPTDFLEIPQIDSLTSPCSQSTRSRAHVLLEAVNRWTEENQWLARGLKQHMDNTFRNFHNIFIEADELKQIQERAVDRLAEAYAPTDN